MVGVVVRIKKEKGFCFVKSREDGADYFLHYTDLTGARIDGLREGQEIDFEPEMTDKGRRARSATCASS